MLTGRRGVGRRPEEVGWEKPGAVFCSWFMGTRVLGCTKGLLVPGPEAKGLLPVQGEKLLKERARDGVNLFLISQFIHSFTCSIPTQSDIKIRLTQFIDSFFTIHIHLLIHSFNQTLNNPYVQSLFLSV